MHELISKILDFDDKEWNLFVENCEPLGIDFTETFMKSRFKMYIYHTKVSDANEQIITTVMRDFMIPLMKILRSTYEISKENDQLDHWINSIAPLSVPKINNILKELMENRTVEDLFNNTESVHALIPQRCICIVGMIKYNDLLENLIDVNFWKTWVQKLNNSNIKSASEN